MPAAVVALRRCAWESMPLRCVEGTLGKAVRLLRHIGLEPWMNVEEFNWRDDDVDRRQWKAARCAIFHSRADCASSEYGIYLWQWPLLVRVLTLGADWQQRQR